MENGTCHSVTALKSTNARTTRASEKILFYLEFELNKNKLNVVSRLIS